MHEEKEGIANMEAAKEHMMSLLEQMKDSGVKLFMDGEAVMPKEAVARTVCENSPYMADYVFGDTGNIEQIRFDKVSNR